MFKPLIATAFALCLLAPGVQAQDAKAIPDLKGQWEGVGEMHHKVHGHVKHDSKMTTMTVLSQEGRVFHGTLDWANKKAPGKDGFSGVIDKDGVTLYVLTPGGANPRAGFADYKRVK